VPPRSQIVSPGLSVAGSASRRGQVPGLGDLPVPGRPAVGRHVAAKQTRRGGREREEGENGRSQEITGPDRNVASEAVSGS